ncbi:hypothetical protein Hneap_2293 [Halothiobacillus neapolitanus c2]|uniref:Pesticin C-terminal domain-containing protein n=1 Tax=Halothiobacillus neapolitanus (strain ATCC 23641 / DSM 15147 / CIP 104769 / NCIMB 8539 / c2) TaxID=555778 RepID=D0KWY3_HALNC|nr:hypothetical protein Hneap_2293 [Halothiobacillus neapolitanus c2]TDN58025.1 phage lysozyme-like predicted toxin [Halothiobacillus neapolitanus]
MRRTGNLITNKLLLALAAIATLATIATTANSSSNTKACPHVCMTVKKGESKADAIKKFEKSNNCVVSGGKSCAKQDRILYVVLKTNENDSRPVALNGYVPKYKNGKAIGKSGVTIGYGVDLGQQDMATLKAWGVSKSLRDKLKPYLGKTKAAAILYLYGDGTKKHPAHPLTITTAEAKELNDGARNYIIGKLATAFDNDNTQHVDFYQLPSNTQTALADFFISMALTATRSTKSFGAP